MAGLCHFRCAVRVLECLAIGLSKGISPDKDTTRDCTKCRAIPKGGKLASFYKISSGAYHLSEVAGRIGKFGNATISAARNSMYSRVAKEAGASHMLNSEQKYIFIQSSGYIAFGLPGPSPRQF